MTTKRVRSAPGDPRGGAPTIRRPSPLALLAACAAVAVAFAPVPAAAQQDDSIETEIVREGSVYMLVGRGGNVGLSIGEDGAFLVDDKFAPLTDEIRAAVAAFTDDEVEFVVNTHWHGDHTGGNENFGEAGSLIVAHENVRKRMNPRAFRDLVGRSEQAPDAALPVVTFTDAVTFHWNGDDIRAFHVEHAHTDGDAIIHFPEADVLHMGDTFFNGTYPFIDVESGGSIDGMVTAARRALDLAGPNTRIIPGHGPLSDADGLRAYHRMLRSVRRRVQALIDEGRSLEEVVDSAPTASFDAEWGGSDFMPPDRFACLVYRGMVEEERMTPC
ncbi:MAG: MBL fold metallo-hydrolase, partial [Gemmatimonadetes bacterium]|nr:MBL fold metallo-hydrolase [Gemmatimonadota bacterium]NIR77447.1 MBL fold metallo-hydrolase [Gemmatimonadota bacterium]NIT85971.1 MBL fold metallo-hydrolase [Gemmatimonadota bacterium]NIU33914.1 MBL fold metallo-hydrolase [Gemmatimonadota bacterium]NIU34813.1 MBL fold metallo-hydrolase [Gemmatimonadota bacterium]